ncbi:hypothetical protein WA171_004860 [Blastocystis sp. BT1]
MILSLFLLPFLFFICFLSFIPTSTSQLSISILSYRFSGKLNVVSALSVSEITVIPTTGISTLSTGSINTILASNNTSGRDPVYELRQAIGTPLVIPTKNGSELRSVNSTNVPTPFVNLRAEPSLQPYRSSFTKTVNTENEMPTPFVSSVVQLSPTPSKATSPTVNPASNSSASHSASVNPTHSSLPMDSTSAQSKSTASNSTQPKPTPSASTHSKPISSTSIQPKPTSTTGSEPPSSLSLVRKWDQECGNLPYSASFACYDKHFQEYYRLNDSSLWNVKSYFNSLIDTNPTPITEPCHSFETFLNRHYSLLTKNCTDVHQYSHCQVYSLIEFNPFKQTCSSWHRQPYVHKEYTGVTLVTQISLSRIDRLPYHLARWKELKVILVMITQMELQEAWTKLAAFKESSLRFILYVVDPQFTPYFINTTDPWTVLQRTRPFYSLNLFRDIAIESITTTHFLMIDGDVFVSADTMKDIERQKSILTRFDTFLILPLFSPTVAKRYRCRFYSCKAEWDMVPLVRKDLERVFRKRRVIAFKGRFHKYQNGNKWIQSRDVYATQVHITGEIEPYGVFRRSALNTFYHPYYVDYGFNKIEFFHRLIVEKYQFYLLPEAFGYDIPHPRSSASNSWSSQRKGTRAMDILWMRMCRENPDRFKCRY